MIISIAIGAVIGLIVGEIYIPWAVKMTKKLKKKEKSRKISQIERDKGRSEDYWQTSPQEQWDEDKRLGILDWDGK